MIVLGNRTLFLQSFPLSSNYIVLGLFTASESGLALNPQPGESNFFAKLAIYNESVDQIMT